MTTSINLTMQAQVSGAGSASGSHNLQVEAFGNVAVTVPAGGNLVVDVQPSGTDQVELLFITASTYSDLLTYNVSGANGATGVRLNAPQLFAGTGAVRLLGETQNTITFDNGEAEDIDVEILVGRDATPPPAP
jgi:hypothetical protein